MRVLLINPGMSDYDRVATIVAAYRGEYLHEERPRHRSVIYTSRNEHLRAVAVWHSPKQITLHFGDDA